jgi:hypothetical protein
MTPSQMLKKIVTPEVKPPLIWVPRPVTTPILVPAGGVSAADLRFMEESAMLEVGKCPTCHAPLDRELNADGWIYFKCTRNPVFHEWRRTEAFLTRD